jgi:arsenite-transporting ATPase
VLAVNGVFKAVTSDDDIACATEEQQAVAIKAMPPGLAAFPRSDTGFIPKGLVGMKP